jgi:hypothetical protein
MLKVGGSKVRCSVCKNIFMVHPPEPKSMNDLDLDESFEETVALDTPPDFDEPEIKTSVEIVEESFDKAFEDALEEEVIKEISEQDSLEDEEVAERKIEKPVKEFKKPPQKRPSITTLRKKQRGSNWLLIVLVVILILVVAAVGIYFFKPGLIPDSLPFLKPVSKEMVEDQGVSRLDFKAVNGSFIQSRRSGQLFVIRGTVINNDSVSRSYILIKGSILDNTDKMIRQMLVYAGNTFSNNELKNKPLADMKEALKLRTGKDNNNVDVPPGKGIPFMIIFEKLPDNLGEFVVEAVSSSRGK